MDQKLETIIQKLPEYFVPSRSEGTSITAQLNLQSDELDYWALKIENQTCEVKHEKAAAPKLELTVTAPDLTAILVGKLNATKAYMQGKLHLKGNILQAMKLLEMFEIPDEILGKVKL